MLRLDRDVKLGEKEVSAIHFVNTNKAINTTILKTCLTRFDEDLCVSIFYKKCYIIPDVKARTCSYCEQEQKIGTPKVNDVNLYFVSQTSNTTRFQDGCPCAFELVYRYLRQHKNCIPYVEYDVKGKHFVTDKFSKNETKTKSSPSKKYVRYKGIESDLANLFNERARGSYSSIERVISRQKEYERVHDSLPMRRRIRNRQRTLIVPLPSTPVSVGENKSFLRRDQEIMEARVEPGNTPDSFFNFPLHPSKTPVQATDGGQENGDTDNAHAPANLRFLTHSNARSQQLPNSRYPEFADASRRIESFNQWPHPLQSIDTRKMSEYGLFFTGPQDLVRCYSCGLGMKDWTAGDDCLLEHVRYSPRCSHLEATVDTYELQDYRNRLQHRNDLIRTGQAPRHPRFASRVTRLESFQTWTNNVNQTPEELAEAGFFYTGQDDRTRCYFCDGGLQHWDEGDEPWVEHARWFPHCEHVRRIKGQQYIDTVQAAVQALEQEEQEGAIGEVMMDMAALNVTEGTGRESDDPIYNPMAQNVMITFGFSKAAVRMAIQECAQNGRRWNTEILVNILYDKQDRGEVLPVDSPRPSSPVQAPNDITTDEGLIAEHRRLKSMLTCLQCEANEANILFLPCAHRRLCNECAQDAMICPICAKQVKEKIRTFMA